MDCPGCCSSDGNIQKAHRQELHTELEEYRSHCTWEGPGQTFLLPTTHTINTTESHITGQTQGRGLIGNFPGYITTLSIPKSSEDSTQASTVPCTEIPSNSCNYEEDPALCCDRTHRTQSPSMSSRIDSTSPLTGIYKHSTQGGPHPHGRSHAHEGQHTHEGSHAHEGHHVHGPSDDAVLLEGEPRPPSRFSSTCCAHTQKLCGSRLNDTGPSPLSPSAYNAVDPPEGCERIVLTISGLKCGCCEMGISRAVSLIPAVLSYQVNIVLARVEIDLDTNRSSVAEIIKKLNGSTGYTFEQYIQPQGQTLELLVADSTEIQNAGMPYGVTHIETGKRKTWRMPSWRGRQKVVPVDKSARNTAQSIQSPPTDSKKRKIKKSAQDAEEKDTDNHILQHTVRIHYDALKIGARDVFEYFVQLAPGQVLKLASPTAEPSIANGIKATKRALAVFLVSVILTIPVLVLTWCPGIDHGKLIYAHPSLALATLVQFIAIKEFVPGALRSLIHSFLFEMDFLIALSTTIAYVFSVICYVFRVKDKPLETGSFFETSTLLVTLILLGRLIGEYARLSAARSVSFRSLQIDEAHVLLSADNSGPLRRTRKIDARLLQYGDRFLVQRHSRIVTDGEVIYGGSEVDESMITGESLKVVKGLGQKVYAGTDNGDGLLVVKLTKLPHENSISRIATLVENAELTKPKTQALADRIAGWFVPVVALIGVSVFLIWLAVERFHNLREPRSSIVRAMTYAISTLIVSCPCAIGLAVPMVVLIAGGVSARYGIIFRDPRKIEIARSITDVVFDKTGTLTTGVLEVVEGQFHTSDQVNACASKGMLLGLLKENDHPVAEAVRIWLEREANKDKSIRPWAIVDRRTIPGCGIVGICKASDLEIRAGNPQWLNVAALESGHTLFCMTIELPSEIVRQSIVGNSSVSLLGKPSVIAATIRLQDQTQNTASTVVNLLKQRNINVHMISGDGEGSVNELAHTLGIPKQMTRFRHRPGQKQKYVKELQNNGGVVMFVGDGLNDAVALRQADVGVHINKGHEIAKSASDVILMTTRLQDILILLDISHAAYRRIILNFGWSALYNVLAILMAAGVFIKFRILPAFAGLGELVSVLPVVLIAFTMRFYDYGRDYREVSETS